MLSRLAPTVGVPKNRTKLLVLNIVLEACKRGASGIPACLPALLVQTSRGGHSKEHLPEVWGFGLLADKSYPLQPCLTPPPGLRTTGLQRKCSWY